MSIFFRSSAAPFGRVASAKVWLEPPSRRKAYEKNREHFYHDPRTGLPYTRWGLTAPLKAFHACGPDVYSYMLCVHSGMALTLVAFFMAIPLLLNNYENAVQIVSKASEPVDMVIWQKLSIGSGCRLSWIQICCDIATSSLFIAYTVWFQRRLLREEHTFHHLQVLCRSESMGFKGSHATQSGFHARPSSKAPRRRISYLRPRAGASEREQDAAITACSVVTCGWPEKDGPPLDRLTDLAGVKPIGVVQPIACSRLVALRRRYDRLLVRRSWYAARDAVDAVANSKGEVKDTRGFKMKWFEWQDKAAGGPSSLRECDACMRKLEKRLCQEHSFAQKLPLAIVTFPSSKAVDKLLRKAEPLNLQVLRAPEPSDIRWEWLELLPVDRRRRRWVAWLILVPCCIISVLGFTTAPYMQGALDVLPPFRSKDGSAAGSFEKLGIFLGFLGVTIVSVQIILQPALQLSINYIGAQTFTSMNWQIMQSMLFWQIGLLVVNCILNLPHTPWTLGIFKENPLFDSWYALGGSAVIMGQVGDTLFINLVVDGANFMALGTTIGAALTSPTQDILNDASAIDLPFYMPLRWELVLKSWLVAFMFSAVMPIILVFHFVMLAGAALVDRINLLSRFQPLPASGNTTARFAAEFLFPVALIIRLVGGTIAYAWLNAAERGLSGAGGVLEAMFTGAEPLVFFSFSLIATCVLLFIMQRQYGLARSRNIALSTCPCLKRKRRFDYFRFEAEHSVNASGDVYLSSDETSDPTFYLQPGLPPPQNRGHRPTLRSQAGLSDDECQKIFAAWDLDGSGNIEPCEMLKNLMDEGYSPAEASDILLTINVEANESVSFEKFLDVWKSLALFCDMGDISNKVEDANKHARDSSVQEEAFGLGQASHLLKSRPGARNPERDGEKSISSVDTQDESTSRATLARKRVSKKYRKAKRSDTVSQTRVEREPTLDTVVMGTIASEATLESVVLGDLVYE